MATIHFRFTMHLDNIEFSLSPQTAHGPLFTRWLPDGQKDAFSIPTGDPNGEVSVWFERRGYTENNEIHYDVQRKEVDPERLQWNRRLDAGPLSGRLIIKDVSAAEVQAMQASVLDDPDYKRIGRRVVGLITETVGRLIRILKVNYGQYWLRDVCNWDSRSQSLGSFCSGLFLQWSLDGEVTWHEFLPTSRTVSDSVQFLTDFSFYLDESDWRQVAAFCAAGYQPTVAGDVLAHAHRLLDQGQLRYAIVEGVSALEISLDEHVRNRYSGRARELLLNDAKGGDTRRLPVRTALIAGMIPGIDQADLESALKIINVRNEMVHEGKSPDPSVKSEVKALFRVVAGVLQQGQFKFPVLMAGKYIGPP